MDTTRYPRVTTHKHRHSSYIHTTNPQHTQHGWTRLDTTEIFQTLTCIPDSEYTRTPIERTRNTTRRRPPARRDRPRRPHTTTTRRRRRDERSEPGVEGGETVHERWFIRHGRHVRDSAVGQCVIRRDATNRVLSRARDSNSIHSFVGRARACANARERARTRGWRDASIGRRGAIVGTRERWMHATN